MSQETSPLVSLLTTREPTSNSLDFSHGFDEQRTPLTEAAVARLSQGNTSRPLPHSTILAKLYKKGEETPEPIEIKSLTTQLTTATEKPKTSVKLDDRTRKAQEMAFQASLHHPDPIIPPNDPTLLSLKAAMTHEMRDSYHLQLSQLQHVSKSSQHPPPPEPHQPDRVALLQRQLKRGLESEMISRFETLQQGLDHLPSLTHYSISNTISPSRKSSTADILTQRHLHDQLSSELKQNYTSLKHGLTHTGRASLNNLRKSESDLVQVLERLEQEQAALDAEEESFDRDGDRNESRNSQRRASQPAPQPHQKSQEAIVQAAIQRAISHSHTQLYLKSSSHSSTNVAQVTSRLTDPTRFPDAYKKRQQVMEQERHGLQKLKATSMPKLTNRSKSISVGKLAPVKQETKETDPMMPPSNPLYDRDATHLISSVFREQDEDTSNELKLPPITTHPASGKKTKGQRRVTQSDTNLTSLQRRLSRVDPMEPSVTKRLTANNFVNSVMTRPVRPFIPPVKSHWDTFVKK